jgi:hypothetical protein
LADISTLNKSTQGSLEWRMHDSQTTAYVAWSDKKTVRLFSTHANPVALEGEATPIVPHRNGAVRDAIPTSPMHLEYTTHADQLRSNIHAK